MKIINRVESPKPGRNSESLEGADRAVTSLTFLTGGMVRGKFPSRKNGRMVYHRGLLALDALYLFETSACIARYREQPAAINYPDGNRLRRYTPDFELVLSNDDIILIGITASQGLQSNKSQHKFKQLIAHTSSADILFHQLNEISIRQEPRLSSLRWLYHQAPRRIPTEAAMRNGLNSRRHNFPQSLKAAQATFAGSGVDIFSLLLAGLVTCSLHTLVTWDTQINLTTEADHGGFCISKESNF